MRSGSVSQVKAPFKFSEISNILSKKLLKLKQLKIKKPTHKKTTSFNLDLKFSPSQIPDKEIGTKFKMLWEARRVNLSRQKLSFFKPKDGLNEACSDLVMK